MAQSWVWTCFTLQICSDVGSIIASAAPAQRRANRAASSLPTELGKGTALQVKIHSK
jgi:hypothetical protein